jgi:septal ring factor EnvC (AmiA/AmiB activator)
MSREDMDFISNLFRSLETEMRREFAEVHRQLAEVNTRLDMQATRLDRIGGLVNGGGRALARLIEWSEKTDVTTEALAKRVAEMDERLRKLESQK